MYICTYVYARGALVLRGPGRPGAAPGALGQWSRQDHKINVMALIVYPMDGGFSVFWSQPVLMIVVVLSCEGPSRRSLLRPPASF